MHTSTLDGRGHITWSDYLHEGFPSEICCSRPVWDLSSGLHRERIRQDFSVALVAREPQAGLYSFESPLDGRTYTFQARYQAAEAAVVCQWKQARAVSILTEKELAVVRLAADDRDNKAIALELGLSESGVAYHWSAIRAKLNCETATGCVAKAMRMDLLDEP